MRVLVTGAAGFIGFHVTRRLLADGHVVTGVDAMTDYYDVKLKRARLAILTADRQYTHHEFRIEDMARLDAVADHAGPEAIIHLAGQAGVRYALEAPRAFVEANVTGTFNLSEVARRLKVSHFVFASTSSVYGGNLTVPFQENDGADHPVSLYAATKKASEAMLHAYAHLWGVPTTVARFFTVYGPWGRPDMALAIFVDNILNDRPLKVFNDGQMERDFTYIDDLVEGLLRLLTAPPRLGERLGGDLDSLSPVAPWRIVNIGGGHPVDLLDFISVIEVCLGRKAKLEMAPMQAGDSRVTFASADLLNAITGFRPATAIEAGVEAYCAWHKAYHGVS